jgi:hypothetical protein
MTEPTETLLKAASRLEVDAEQRARREHDIRLMRTMAESLRGTAEEHVADANGQCVACADAQWPCASTRRWLVIANIALEERPPKPGT